MPLIQTMNGLRRNEDAMKPEASIILFFIRKKDYLIKIPIFKPPEKDKPGLLPALALA
jgi:hypothetical protein